MAGKVVAVHVLNAQGRRVRLEADGYRALVEDVVVLPQRGQLGEIIFTNIPGRRRSKAVDNQIKGNLQDTGELFPTE